MPIGGAERQALKLAERLIETGVNVTVVTGQWDWGQPRREKINNVRVHRHFTGWGMFDVRGLRRFGQYLYLLTLLLYLVIHRDEYDIIHCHSAIFNAPIAALAATRLHKKSLIRSMAGGPWGDIKRHSEGEEERLQGSRWMLGQMSKADCVVALNKQIAEELTAIGVQPERIVHVPNGVELEVVKPKTDYRLGRDVTLVFLGRLHPQKGVDVLLMAFKEVQQALPQFSWCLKLVGEGRLRSRLEALARQLSIEQDVQFLGQVSDPFPILSQSDIFVLPSRSEGMSNALLEAMAHGLPCIVTDIGGNNEVVKHNENGLLVRLDDHKDLAAGIACLAMDHGLRERLGQAALRAVEEKYSLRIVADRYVTLYADLLHNCGDIGHRGTGGGAGDREGAS